jgi:hypothetical protein
MCALGFAKRFLPFAATLAIGLFIASFFVDLTPPRFENRNRGWHKFQRIQQLRSENQQLREENRRLTQQLNELRQTTWMLDSHYDIPPVPPPPAAAPRRAR